MKTFNKIQLASSMFIEAHNRYNGANKETDYILSILLSGAVIGIIGPLRKEQRGHTTHELLARISNAIAEPGDAEAYAGMFREVYNSLKHAGNARKKISASDDLEIRTDLKKEAAQMLDAAKDDFRDIEISDEVRKELSEQFRELLQLPDNYA